MHSNVLTDSTLTKNAENKTFQCKSFYANHKKNQFLISSPKLLSYLGLFEFLSFSFRFLSILIIEGYPKTTTCNNTVKISTAVKSILNFKNLAFLSAKLIK